MYVMRGVLITSGCWLDSEALSLACLDCSFKISDSLSSGALGSLHLRDRSIGMHLASVHSIVMHADCCFVMHHTRCMRADRCVCILLDRCASCSMRSCVVHACSMQCNARDRSRYLHATRCNAAVDSLRGHALNRCAVMHVDRCAVMRVSLWERFGIVRQTRGVDILSELVVGACRESYS